MDPCFGSGDLREKTSVFGISLKFPAWPTNLAALLCRHPYGGGRARGEGL
jgi:hypothetical protein